MSKKSNSFNLKLNEYDDVQFNAGSASSLKSLNSCFYIISFFAELEDDTKKRSITDFFYMIRKSTYAFLRRTKFSTRYLYDIKMPHTIEETRLGFVTCEFTFFAKEEIDKTYVLKTLNDLSEFIYRTNFVNKDGFKIRRNQYRNKKYEKTR